MSEVLATRRQPISVAVPPLLSFIAGFVDSYTFLVLFGLFVAQVTGSFVLAAVAFVSEEEGVLLKTLGIPVFLLAAVVTTALSLLAERRGRSAVELALGLESAVLTGFLLALVFGWPHSNPNAIGTLVASLLGLFAMGMQSATVRLLMKNVASTNVMTTNTTQFAIDATEFLFARHAARKSPTDASLAAYDAVRARLVGLFPIMLAFLVGTGAGTLAYVTTGLWGLLVPLAVIYAIFAWALFRKRS
jgi:uncharacterized membrane protein YoaK (UPF0700 family)